MCLYIKLCIVVLMSPLDYVLWNIFMGSIYGKITLGDSIKEQLKIYCKELPMIH